MKKYNISFVLPMFNEAQNIAESIARVTRLAREIADDYEIVVVDDASNDGSGGIVDALAFKDIHIKSIKLKKNTKFGGALKEGLKAASKDVVFYTDSDLPAKDEDMKKGIELMETSGSDVVSAYSLVIKDSRLKRVIMSKGYNFLVRLLFGLKMKDINAGLKIYRRHVLKGLDLRSKSPFIDVEIFAEAAKRNCKISQYGLVFDHRVKGKSTISRPGVVAQTFWDMLKYRFF